MSVICAVVDNGIVYMGCDTQTTGEKDKDNKIYEAGFKITKLNNGMLIGVCGVVDAKQMIVNNESIFQISSENLSKKEIVNVIIPKIRKCLQCKKWDKCEKDELPISIMLAYKDKLYMIYSDYNVIRIEDYYSSGAGRDYTFSSLLDESQSVKNRILNGLRMSAKRCESVSGPFVLIDTKKLEYEIVEE